MSIFAAKWNRFAIPVIALMLCFCLCPATAQAAEIPQTADAPAAACSLTTQAKKSLATLKASGKLKIALAKSKTYTGKAIKPKPTLKLNGKKLVRGRDFAVVYKNAKGKVVTPKAVGTYKVIIKGKGSYKGSITRTFKILKKQVTLKTSAFKVKLPRYWTGKVKIGTTVRNNSTGYNHSLWVNAKKGGYLLYFMWGPKSSTPNESGLLGDVPDVGIKAGSKYRVYVGTINWALNGQSYGAYDLTKAQAANLVKLLTGGKITKLPSRYSTAVIDKIDSYLIKNVVKKMTVK